jgi:hypothetical protein
MVRLLRCLDKPYDQMRSFPAAAIPLRLTVLARGAAAAQVDADGVAARATRRSCPWGTAAAGGEAVPDRAVAPAAGGREAVAEGRPMWLADSRRAGAEVCPLLV